MEAQAAAISEMRSEIEELRRQNAGQKQAHERELEELRAAHAEELAEMKALVDEFAERLQQVQDASRWKPQQTPDGKLYWFNDETKETSWQPPAPGLHEAAEKGSAQLKPPPAEIAGESRSLADAEAPVSCEREGRQQTGNEKQRRRRGPQQWFDDWVTRMITVDKGR